MKRHFVCVILITFSTWGSAARAAEHYEVQVERNVAAKMRDGVVLRADIYRPKLAGKFPVLLTRTPYDKNLANDSAMAFAARGYVVVVQDVRGRFTSDGEWYPLKNDSEDGYDTVEWAAALPSANGKVGMFGGSYVGVTQMLTATAAPPHLAGIMPVNTSSNYHEGWNYQGGALDLWFNESWTTLLAINTYYRRLNKNSRALDWEANIPPSGFPVLDFSGTSGVADYYFDWLAHPAYDDYWKQWSISEHFAQVRVPALHVGSWYDAFQDGSLGNYVGIKAHGANEAARTGQRLLVTVGGHSGNGPMIGDVDFGKDSGFNANELTLRWYDYLLKGIDNGLGSEKPVKIFVMGRNAPREEEAWPLARAQEKRYYLHSTGPANTLRGKGALSIDPPTSEAADKFVYDPADPVRSLGGPLCCGPPHPGGAFDQRPIENREDVLVYTTPAFSQGTEITGRITLDLYASSSAVDTDFTGKVIDVEPNGFARNLTEGILRARYRQSREKAEFMNPGEVYKLTLDLWSTSNVFLAGHKLRLEVSSSNFPRFDRNLNTGDNQAHSQRMVKATNTIYHDREHPSALVVPAVP